MRRPKIALPKLDQDVTNYVNALLAAGMEPVIISKRSRVVQECDGLLLPGGGDINPARYGQENHGSRNMEDALDALQFAVLDDFVKSGRPVLGICRGHQVINVYFGGTLVQHLPTAFRHAHKTDEPDRVHSCIAGEESWLSKLYGTKFAHNSSHHQAVGICGSGLAIDSHCPEDGTVEAMHHETLPIYSVQWHPERMCLAFERDDTVNGLPVLEFFCRLCCRESSGHTP